MFLNPLLLIGLSAVAVPIVIHMLNRRKHLRVVWAAMRFVELALRKNQRRMNIEDILLLILRCALLALLALAMARPALHGALGFFSQARVDAVIILDNSYSMSQTDGAVSRFEQSQKKVVDEVIQTLPGGASASLLLASDTVQEVISEPTYDLNLVRQRASQAQMCDRGTNMLPALQRAVKILQARQGSKKEIYLITDAQASGWRQEGEIRQILDEVKQDISTHIIFVGEQGKQNVGVSSLTLATSPAPVNQPLRFEVGVTNYGQSAVKDLPVRLSVDNEPPSEQVNVAALEPGETRSVAMYARIAKEGMHSITARIPHDQLPRDDERSLLVRVIPKVHVLLVDGKAGRGPRDCESFFLQEALQPVEPMLREKFFIQTRVISAGELDATRLDEYDVIVLANVPDVSRNVVQSLDRLVRDGRGLIVLPGDQVNVKFYNKQLLETVNLLPAMLGEAKGETDQGDKFWTYQAKGFTHPIVSIWNDPGAGNMANVRTYRRFEMTLAVAEPGKGKDAKKADEEISLVLAYNDGQPAVAERTHGLGKVVMFAGPVSTSGGWNDLAVRPKVFLPLLHRMVGSILSRQEQYLNLRVGQKLTWRVGEDLIGRDMMVARPGDDKRRDSLKVELLNGYPTVQYTQTDVAGLYSATVNGEMAPNLRFAVQCDAAESRMEVIGKEQADALGTVASVDQWIPGMALQDKLKSARTGSEIWFPIAVLAALVAGLETYLAFRFSQTK